MITHPSLTLLSHTFSREDLFLVIYCLVDDWMHARFGAANRPRRRRGPRPDEFSDAEVLTVLLVGELCHCRRETAWLRQVRASYRALFPALPSDSRLSRRAEQVRELLRAFRAALLFWADADLEPFRLFDSFPQPLCACYRIRQSRWPLRNAHFGYNASKKQYFYGMRPQVLITASGFIEDLILAPGYYHDPVALAGYLDECVEEGRDLAGQVWVLDNGYWSPPIAAWAKERLGLTLLARRRDKKGEPTSFWQATLDHVRKPIEGMISVLTECFGIEHLLVKTEIGLYRRMQAKATAFTLGRYINRVLNLAPLNLARYAV
jgi:hypothetical protein